MASLSSSIERRVTFRMLRSCPTSFALAALLILASPVAAQTARNRTPSVAAPDERPNKIPNMKTHPIHLAATNMRLLVNLIAVIVGAAVSVSHAAPAAKALSDPPTYDVVVYGDSSAAVTAAIAAQREGRSVILVNPTGFPGGMSASGLGASDFLGKRNTFGGIASEFYDAIAAAYGEKYIRSFEPHVGRRVFEKMIADAGVTVVYNEQLDRTPGKGVTMQGKRITTITTLSGKTYRGRVFIDATYVGDLLADGGLPTPWVAKLRANTARTWPACGAATRNRASITPSATKITSSKTWTPM